MLGYRGGLLGAADRLDCAEGGQAEARVVIAQESGESIGVSGRAEVAESGRRVEADRVDRISESLGEFVHDFRGWVEDREGQDGGVADEVVPIDEVQMQERLFGSSILNPAFYYPPLDQIFAFSELEKWETLVEEVRKVHDGLREAIDRIEGELQNAQIEFKSGRREARDEIRRSALEQKRSNRSLSSQRRRAANRAVDEWYRASLEALDAEEDRLREEIRKFEGGFTESVVIVLAPFIKGLRS